MRTQHIDRDSGIVHSSQTEMTEKGNVIPDGTQWNSGICFLYQALRTIHIDRDSGIVGSSKTGMTRKGNVIPNGVLRNSGICFLIKLCAHNISIEIPVLFIPHKPK